MNLVLVPTPIGNLGDITLRALETLRNVDVILCEDTRTSSVMLNHYEIKKPLWAYHQHNEHQLVSHLISQLQAGKTMALISDAGTPGISDPGYLLVRSCLEAGIAVTCLPGATAFVPALVQSGFVSNSFVFEGFLPLKKGRKTALELLAQESRTVILYESPHRISKLLQELIGVVGEDRKVCISREISKKFEEHLIGSLAEVSAKVQAHPLKGELVLVLEGKDEQERRNKQKEKQQHSE